MLNKKNKIPVEYDIRAVSSLACKVLKNSDRPVHNEVGEILDLASSDWIERIEYLEEKLAKYHSIMNKIENSSKNGLQNFLSEKEYEDFYNDD